ncbi:sialate O-acetylesterase [Fulvivirga ligni]|uniref:sialate O-acetylesterase n=1 Tax=Fulvivirga ligni TaxID=2904246 RepID=UPI001F328A38|nr:sialate O-acetylesterase [Fulvivirga ligni]UII19261.1 sialate O-acetylesterase [Fulvivirga ligni]
MQKLILIVLAVMVFQSTEAQDLTLPKIFTDHMVLQRDQPVKVWGWAKAGEKVTVSIDGLQASTKADEKGSWLVSLGPHKAGGPYTLRVQGATSLEIKDVFYGEVWLAGGQSNMEWKIGWKIDNWEEEQEDAEYPDIRFFEVQNVLSPYPKSDIPAANWIKASKETAKEFSAVAWFFAKHNHKEKNIPVGIIDSNWGGTPAEAWTDAHKLLTVEGYEKEAEEVLDPKVDWTEKVAENEANQGKKFSIIGDKEGAKKTGAQEMAFDDKSWQTVKLPNQNPLSDVAWLRKSFDLKAVTNTNQLYLGDLVQEAMIFLNGKLVAEESWQDTTSIISVPKDLLKKGKNVLALRVINSWDNRVMIGKPGKMWLKNGSETINLEGDWKYSNAVEPKLPQVEFYNWQPGFLYNAMIAPLTNYGLKGVIWYQGENNAGAHQYYEGVFKALIQDWRDKWEQPNMPFLYVQLANYMERKGLQPNSDWAYLRDAQTHTLDLPSTGMATIIDIGDAGDVHPRNKQDVGYRLWLAARKVAYGEDIVYSGPAFKSMQIKDNQVIISFDHIGSGLKTQGDLTAFIIAGKDGIYHRATAKIVGDKVVVSSPEVANPAAVRYAWADNPMATLYNKEGLPAVPFKTD